MSQIEKNDTGIHRCKHCGVRVISKTDTRVVLGTMHPKCCPRRKRA